MAVNTSSEVARMPHTNRGRRQNVIPSARIVTTVVTKLIAPRIEDIPRMTTLMAHSVWPSGARIERGT